ncbi:hypothetical protein MARPO_0034s0072 [Marchantia polymorpha]|uniref:EF-hand domain-containing protein n=1 Tax=Marchantia polymorpha TaxID=3197 RepID=A0A2R6X5W8_MARPO|nr:hypothetical protein MARPO_0034s0072 [Marchantia polymorpha]|eukprot:PTQ41487.1 hypothetical protein MARPO_0034s0072 [Marchantia polymorpha]
MAWEWASGQMPPPTVCLWWRRCWSKMETRNDRQHNRGALLGCSPCQREIIVTKRFVDDSSQKGYSKAGAAEASPLNIMGFGLSRIDGVTSPVVGIFRSIYYVAPEALLPEAVLSASDMWSLGVILYILLRGQCSNSLFHARTNREKQNLILSGAYGQDVIMRIQSLNARRKFRAAGFASIFSSKVLLRTRKLKTLVGSNKISAKKILESFKHISETSYSAYRVLFTRVQQTEQGRRFEDVLKAMNLASLVTMAQRVFDLFDGNKDGCVDMREIIVGFFSE